MRKNKLIAITRVKNEVDIIEPFVRHHAHHFDRIIALDDGSTDGTYEILGKLQAGGAPLVLLREATIGYDQQEYMTRLMHIAVNQFGADWVAPLDADEFVEPAEGAEMADLLAGRESELLSLGWSNFAWQSKAGSEIHPVLRLTSRLPARSDHAKVLVPATLVIGGSAQLLQGNHYLTRNGVNVAAVPLRESCLCHFPIRSVQQYASKIAIGHLQYATCADQRIGQGYHYDAPFKALLSGLDRFASSMEEESRNYSTPPGITYHHQARYAPLRYLGGPLLHTPDEHTDFLANILSYAQSLADRLVQERTQAGPAR